jgi:hypothetical protein
MKLMLVPETKGEFGVYLVSNILISLIDVK